MFCTKCGAIIADGSKFCTRCGAAANAAPPIISAEPAAPAPVPKEKNNRTLMIILIAALAVLVTTGIILTVVLLSGATSTDRLWQEQYDLGSRYLSDGEYEEAAIAFLAAIDIDPKRPEAYRGAADAYIAMGDYESAAEILDRGAEETGDEALKDSAEQIQQTVDSQLANRRLTQINCYDASTGSLEFSYHFIYNNEGLLESYRRISGNVDSYPELLFEFQYDRSGRLTLYRHSFTQNDGSYVEFLTEYQYNDIGQLTSKICHFPPYEIDYEYNEEGILVESIGNYSTFQTITKYEHNDDRQLVFKQETSKHADSSSETSYYYEYDAFDRLYMETCQTANREIITTYDYSYRNFVLIQPDNELNRLVMQDVAGEELFSLEWLQTIPVADSNGFISEVTAQDSSGNPLSYEFIYEDRIPEEGVSNNVKHLSKVTLYYDDSWTQEYIYSYNENNQLTKLTTFNYDNGQVTWSSERFYNYDAAGLLISEKEATSPQAEREYHYSDGVLIGYTDYEIFGEDTVYASSHQLQQDNDGNVVSLTTVGGDPDFWIKANYTYDANGRILSAQEQEQYGDHYFERTKTFDHSYPGVIVVTSEEKIFDSVRTVRYITHPDLEKMYVHSFELYEGYEIITDADGYITEVTDENGIIKYEFVYDTTAAVVPDETTATPGLLSEEEAYKIACDYWDYSEGDIAQQTGFELFVVAEYGAQGALWEQSGTGKQYYSFMLQWLVVADNGDSWMSTCDIIHVDAETGECTYFG